MNNNYRQKVLLEDKKTDIEELHLIKIQPDEYNSENPFSVIINKLDSLDLKDIKARLANVQRLNDLTKVYKIF